MLLEPVTLTIVGALLSTFGAWVIWKLKKKNDKKAKKLDDILDLRKAVWRLNKTVLIMAKMLDSLSEKAHPEFASELEEIARELLSTSDDYDEDS